MSILLAFAPFLVFLLVERLSSTLAGLVAAAIVSFAMIIRDRLSVRSSWKVLDIGTVLLFGGLAAFVIITGETWSIAEVRLRVDAGLLAIVLLSLAIRLPFTLQYAREQAPKELWSEPRFVRANYRITMAWAAAFAVMVVVDLLLVYSPDMPTWAGVGVTVVALAAAIRFTSSYSERMRTSSAR